MTWQLPWEAGKELDSLYATLNERLSGSNVRVLYAEISGQDSGMPTPDQPPLQSRVILSDPGITFPSNKSIKDEGDDGTTDDEDVPLDEDVTLVLKILEPFYYHLAKTLLPSDNPQHAALGVRVLISAGQGTTARCAGYRCEYRDDKDEMWVRRYYKRNNACKKRWVEPCT